MLKTLVLDSLILSQRKQTSISGRERIWTWLMNLMLATFMLNITALLEKVRLKGCHIKKSFRLNLWSHLIILLKWLDQFLWTVIMWSSHFNSYSHDCEFHMKAKYFPMKGFKLITRIAELVNRKLLRFTFVSYITTLLTIWPFLANKISLTIWRPLLLEKLRGVCLDG